MAENKESKKRKNIAFRVTDPRCLLSDPATSSTQPKVAGISRATNEDSPGSDDAEPRRSFNYLGFTSATGSGVAQTVTEIR